MLNWATVVSPTLGCSIEISRDTYMYVFDCLWEKQKKLYAKMRGQNYVVQTRACSKIIFGSLKRSADYLPLGILNSTVIRRVKTDL